MENGWIKTYRKTLDNPIVCKDADHLAVWMYLLWSATHTEVYSLFGGKRVTLRPGQLITGRKKISEKLKISESKVQRILKTFEIEQQIEQQTDYQSRLISVLNWSLYQETEQQIEQRPNSDRTATEQRVNTIQECKNVKNEEEVVEGKKSTTLPSDVLHNIKFNVSRELSDIFKEMDSNMAWKEQMCMKHSVPGATIEIKLMNFDKYLSEFYKFLTIDKQVKQKSLSDTYYHFSNWLTKQLKNNG